LEQSAAHVLPAQQRLVLHGLPMPQAAGGAHTPFEQRSPPLQSVEEPQPQTPLGRQIGPSAELPQSTQVAPFWPHALFALGAHALPPQQKPCPHVPSPVPPQALVHWPAEHVGLAPLHVAQALPSCPHALLLALPPTHVEVAPSQHPPLHCRPPAHDEVHAWPEPHAVPVGQSPAALHPHAPWMHLFPLAELVQSTQLPGVPQLCALPAQGAAPSGVLTSAGASGAAGASVVESPMPVAS
jgi:hypothetical protein